MVPMGQVSHEYAPPRELPFIIIDFMAASAREEPDEDEDEWSSFLDS